MATDLERLVVSLDADVSRLSKQLARAGIDIGTFGRNADAQTKAAGRKIAENLAGGGGARDLANIAPQFTHIGKSIVDMVLAGQSPLRALTVEGGNIIDAFGAGGGVLSTFRSVGGALTGLVSPAGAAAGAVLYQPELIRTRAPIRGVRGT